MFTLYVEVRISDLLSETRASENNKAQN